MMNPFIPVFRRLSSLPHYRVFSGFPTQDDITVSHEDVVMSMCHGERIAHNQDYDLYKYRDRLTVDFTLKGCQH
ncbi:hypothetical protein WDV93_21950 [Pantoea ananatis]